MPNLDRQMKRRSRKEQRQERNSARTPQQAREDPAIILAEMAEMLDNTTYFPDLPMPELTSPDTRFAPDPLRPLGEDFQLDSSLDDKPEPERAEPEVLAEFAGALTEPRAASSRQPLEQDLRQQSGDKEAQDAIASIRSALPKTTAGMMVVASIKEGAALRFPGLLKLAAKTKRGLKRIFWRNSKRKAATLTGGAAAAGAAAVGVRAVGKPIANKSLALNLPFGSVPGEPAASTEAAATAAGFVQDRALFEQGAQVAGDPALPLPPYAPAPLNPFGDEFTLQLPEELRRRNDAPGVRRKLAIGSTDDPLEAEADRAADAALAGPPGVAGRVAPLLQRRDSGDGVSADAVPASVERTLAGSGQPLDAATRADMEARFGHDFSHVRVHSDAAAARSARDVGAHAYTAGGRIAFAAGRFAPHSGEGRHLLAHELAHVVQQGAQPLSTAAPVRRKDANPLDDKAKAIIAAAKDEKKTVEERARQLVRDIVAAYWDPSKVVEVVFDPKEGGVSTSPIGKGATNKGKIFVGPTFLGGVDQFARRVIQVGHELQHVDQQRAGMGGDAKKDEREFLAFAWGANEPEKQGTGRVTHSTRVEMIDRALRHYFCMSADKQTEHKSRKEALLELRKEHDGKAGNDKTQPPTECKP